MTRDFFAKNFVHSSVHPQIISKFFATRCLLMPLWRNNYHRSLTDLFSYADKFDRLDVSDHSLLVNIESLLIFFQKVFLLGWFTGWIEIQAPTTTTTRSHWQIASSSYCQCNYCLQLPKFLYENSCDGFVPKTLAAFAIADPATTIKRIPIWEVRSSQREWEFYWKSW